jgi:hypothetical protein
MTQIQLAVFDLDGTLMGDDLRISQRVREAIAEALAEGVTVTIATGRMFAATRSFAQELGISAPLLSYQGGWIQALDDAEPRYRVPLSPEVTERALQLAEQEDWHTALYAGGAIYMRRLHYSPSFYEQLLGEDYRIVDAWEEALAHRAADKVLFIAEPERIPSMGERLRAVMGKQAEIFRSHAKFIEVVPRGVDKGRGLAWLASHLGVAQEAVMGVGDQENDVPLVRWAGLGIAMGNAAPAVKEAADWIAPPLKEDGAAVAIERFILKRGSP